MDEKKYETQKPMMYDIKEHEFACGKQNGRIQFIQISPNVTLQYCEIRQPHEVGPTAMITSRSSLSPRASVISGWTECPTPWTRAASWSCPPTPSITWRPKATCSW